VPIKVETGASSSCVILFQDKKIFIKT